MTAIIFNGALERNPLSTSGALSAYIAEKLKEYGVESKIFNLADSGIPLFDTTLKKVPNGVEVMNTLFLAADIHFWLAPLYHGSIPGVMKNCLDWLEVSAKMKNLISRIRKSGLSAGQTVYRRCRELMQWILLRNLYARGLYHLVYLLQERLYMKTENREQYRKYIKINWIF